MPTHQGTIVPWCMGCKLLKAMELVGPTQGEMSRIGGKAHRLLEHPKGRVEHAAIPTQGDQLARLVGGHE